MDELKEWNQRVGGEVWSGNGGEAQGSRDFFVARADLARTDLAGADLTGARLAGAILTGANLKEANLTRAYLAEAHLKEADLSGADLRRAHLIGADLYGANLERANMARAHLIGADLTEARLGGTDLTEAGLNAVIFNRTHLGGFYFGASTDAGTILTGATCLNTIFTDVDLSETVGLDFVNHRGPSHVSTSTLIRSRGRIPESFLRGCGLPDAWIEYLPSLMGTMQPIQFYSCFISYSSMDTPFAERLYADLQARGVRCWFAPNDLRIGDRFRLRIDESIRLHAKLLIVLSEAAVASQEVEAEVEAAMEREKAPGGGTVLFPVRLDDAVMKAPGWPALVRRTRHIGDFRGWKDHDAYQEGFARLLRDLKAEAARGGEKAPGG